MRSGAEARALSCRRGALPALRPRRPSGRGGGAAQPRPPVARLYTGCYSAGEGGSGNEPRRRAACRDIMCRFCASHPGSGASRSISASHSRVVVIGWARVHPWRGSPCVTSVPLHREGRGVGRRRLSPNPDRLESRDGVSTRERPDRASRQPTRREVPLSNSTREGVRIGVPTGGSRPIT